MGAGGTCWDVQYETTCWSWDAGAQGNHIWSPYCYGAVGVLGFVAELD